MLGIPYPGDDYDETYIRKVLKDLSSLGAGNVVLTGTKFNAGEVGFMGYNAQKDEYFSYAHRHIPVSFHGTGDVFSSTAVGALTMGKDLMESMKIAADYTVDCIERTMQSPDHVNYAVEFERMLPSLMRTLGK